MSAPERYVEADDELARQVNKIQHRYAYRRHWERELLRKNLKRMKKHVKVITPLMRKLA